MSRIEFADSSLAELCFRTITGNSKYVGVTSLPANRSYEIRSSGPEYTNVILEEILFRYVKVYHSNNIINDWGLIWTHVTKTLNKIILVRHREYYKTKKCVMRCDKNEIPVADLYRTIEEYVALKRRLNIIQVN